MITTIIKKPMISPQSTNEEYEGKRKEILSCEADKFQGTAMFCLKILCLRANTLFRQEELSSIQSFKFCATDEDNENKH